MIRKLDEAKKRAIRNRMVDAFQIATAIFSIVALNYALTFSAELLSSPNDWKNIAWSVSALLSCVAIPTFAVVTVLVMEDYKKA